MKKEFLRPLINAIFALFLIILVRIAAQVMLKKVDTFYLAVDVVLSLAVVVVLLKFMKDFNRQLEISSMSRHVVTWIVILLVILTLYSAFSQFSEYLPYGSYHIIFFILVLVPVYYLWNILYKNTGALTEFLRNISLDDEITCSCGWKNPVTAMFCSRCGSTLKEKGTVEGLVEK